MSDEYSVHTRFLTGKIDGAEYKRKMDYMRAQEEAEEADVRGREWNRPLVRCLLDGEEIEARWCGCGNPPLFDGTEGFVRFPDGVIAICHADCIRPA